jgi:hypothetical protein
MVAANPAGCTMLSPSLVKEIGNGMCSVIVDDLYSDNVSREAVNKRVYNKLVPDESYKK